MKISKGCFSKLDPLNLLEKKADTIESFFTFINTKIVY